MLPDGRRLHLHDGPIDLIVEAFGETTTTLAPRTNSFETATTSVVSRMNGFGKGTTSAVPLRDRTDRALAPEVVEIIAAYRAAAARFVTILDELCSELPLLRQPVRLGGSQPRGMIAKRMMAAVAPHSDKNFITPMAAVAGAVAEEILGTMTSAANLSRAYVNNGGDIALHLAPGQSFVIGMVERPGVPALFGKLDLHSTQPVRGIATSGWRGRSFSLGIADAVTVLADRAATADAAATIIANAVDLPGHPSITRAPAREIAPDSDLGNRLVTQNVGELSPHEIACALDAGVAVADSLLFEGLIRAAASHLRGETRIVGVNNQGRYQPSSYLGTGFNAPGSNSRFVSGHGFSFQSALSKRSAPKGAATSR
jgi:hypothetical protein